MPADRFARAIACAGLALLPLVGALVGCGGPASERPSDVRADEDCRHAEGSYFLARIGTGELAVDAMQPYLFSTRREVKPATCPVSCEVISGGAPAAAVIGDYLCVLGPLDLGRVSSAGALANEVSAKLARSWATLRGAFHAVAEGGGPVRLLAKHYPLVAAPGRCVVTQSTFYTLPDLYLDRGVFGVIHEPQRVFPGVVVRLRRVYQLQGGTPRLVEAWIEVADRHRMDTVSGSYAQQLELPEIPEDPDRHAHFEDLVPRVRWGVCWIDRAYGQGAQRPAARGYRVRDGACEFAPLPAAWQRALLDLAGRA